MRSGLLFLFLLSPWTGALAEEFYHLARSPKALLMGDAFTAIADDEYTLFYNPAALARHHGFSLTPINPMITGSNIIDDTDRFDDFPDDPVDIADRIMNFPLHVGLNAAPGFKMDRFAMSLVFNNQINLNLRNKIHPLLSVDYNYDRGVLLGYAHPLGGGSLSNKKMEGSQTAVGVGLKFLDKEGLYDEFPLTGTDILDAASSSNSDEIDGLLENLGYTEDSAIGVDLGIEHSIKSGPSRLTFASVVKDIADTKFGEDIDGKRLRNHPMDWNMGAAYQFKTFLFHTSLSLDLQHLNHPDLDFRQKFRFGGEVGIPLVSVYGGFSEGYYSYGLGVNLLLLKLYAGFYSVEVGNAYKQQRSSRFMVYLNLLEISFDV